MTDWKENELYFNIKFDVYNETIIFKIYRVRTKYGTAKAYEDLTFKIFIMPIWTSTLMEELPNKMKNKPIK